MARQSCDTETVQGGTSSTNSSEAFLRLGIQYATGGDGEPDLIAAHKWLNIAAICGNRQALQYRRDIAAEMTQDQIDRALKQARAWLHPR